MAVLGAFAVPHPPIIMPEIGRGEERKIELTSKSYREAARRACALNPDVFVVFSPHTVMYLDYFHISPGASAQGDFGDFGRPDVKVSVKYDEELAKAIAAEAAADHISAGFLGERNKKLDHAVMIPVRYLQEFRQGVPIVRIGLSGFPAIVHYQFGKAVARAVEKLNRRAVIIASGDLSHRLKQDGPYGFAEEGPVFDQRVMKIFKTGDFGELLEFSPEFCDAAAECGLRSFIMMAGTLDGRAVKSDVLSHEDTFGVGYGVACFEPQGPDGQRHFDQVYLRRKRRELDKTASKEDPYVRLARLGLETYVKTGRRAEMPDNLPPELSRRRAGVFVSLKKDGQLRGCIGTISAVMPCVAEEILRNAVSAGTEDPRFPAVTEDELPWLVYDVDVLTDAEPADRSHLDVKRYGVIVRCGGRCGLLLPDLDGVTTVDQQISIALRKAGIAPDEQYSIERFEVVRHL